MGVVRAVQCQHQSLFISASDSHHFDNCEHLGSTNFGFRLSRGYATDVDIEERPRCMIRKVFAPIRQSTGCNRPF
jgi:hypothetical protein